MALVTAWRNPFPPVRIERKVQRLLKDQFGTLYVVTGPDATQEYFELYQGGATRSDERRLGEAEPGSARPWYESGGGR